jgi:orotate phosphoribosyltransferase
VNRKLFVTRRTVSPEGVDRYDGAWMRLADAAARADVRAWRYRATASADEFIEFLEAAPSGSWPPARLTEPLADLEAVAEGRADTWLDASAPRDRVPHRARLLSLIRERSLRKGDFVLASGAKSNYYIDARVTTMSGAGQNLIGEVCLQVFAAKGWTPRCVGGLTLGADPIAYAIAHNAARRGLDIDAFTVRKQAKTHGTGRRIEGAFTSEGTVVVVEDVITTGESALQAVEVIREAGARIVGVLALVDRMEGGRNRLESEGLDVAALFDRTDLLAD